MRFNVLDSVDRSVFKLIYLPNESSIDVIPKPIGGIASLLVNYLQLEVNHNGCVLYPWGVFNHPSTWREVDEYPQGAVRGTLSIDLPQPIVPGVSHRVNKETVWPAFVNRVRGWIGLGDPTPRTSRQVVEFAPSSIAVLDDSLLVAIWLHPESLPAAS